MKLSEIKSDKILIVRGLAGDDRFISRTSSMGITVGSKLEILQNEKKQPMLVYCRDTMIALNRRECEKIEVEVYMS